MKDALQSRRMRQSGFTLIEALVVISVTAVLLALAVPQMRDFLSKQAVLGSASALAGSLQLARVESIKRNAPVSVCRAAGTDTTPSCLDANGAWKGGWIVFVDRAELGEISGDDQLLSVFVPSHAIASTTEERASSAAITFYPVGPVAGVNGSSREITFVGATGGGDFKRSVCLTPMGRIDVKEGGLCG